ncbi:imidazole glycerol phosphate synthase subunit HisH [Taibaiella koreensis]|uniref:imidazole glycerol phosphate synthase subunit HisH n=1 Tax=Taibaiella koreensis TaxID=1268548 RepID=UPI000E5992C8|nr:imidazole glycerol phosphate synthase subunit HisH [Taibaiella koreensis]
MKKSVVIIDYGLGNIYSIDQACRHVGYTPILTSDKDEILGADSVILPGVGAFPVAMERLKSKGLTEVVKTYAAQEKPLMGVCLGMQLLLNTSEEFGECEGLGIIEGNVKRFPKVWKDNKLKIPHIGWNKIFTRQEPLAGGPFDDILNDLFMYFVHSYYVETDSEENVLTYTYYEDFKFCSAIQKKNIFGFQFHPEKSGEQGLSLYEKFLSI